MPERTGHGHRDGGWGARLARARDRVQSTSEESERPVRRRFVEVGGRSLFTRQVPGPPGTPTIVLVHGLGMSGLTFVPLLRQFAGRAQVWAPDLPGFGRSTKPEHALELDELADALADWVAATGITPDCFLGHSLGAQIVAQLALSRPGAVPAAVLVGPTRDPRAGSLLHQGWRMLKDLPREPLSLARLAVRDYLSATPGRMVRTMHDALDTRVRERARALHLPVLLIRGEHDPVVPPDWAAELCELLPDGRLAEIAGAPHGATYTHPGEVAALTLDFLTASGGAPRGTET